MSSGVRSFMTWVAMSVIWLVIVGVVYFFVVRKPEQTDIASAATHASGRHQPFRNYTLWWDDLPEEVEANRVKTGSESNIRPADHSGPESCRKCHPKNYESWSHHAHRWMNALANDSTVKGDFSERRISYLGGEATFYKDQDTYRMRLERGDVKREFKISQTVGSRFFQYYVGTQLAGPEPADHPLYTEGHVLPFGYWLDRREWVPVVHIHGEPRESERHDPFAPRLKPDWSDLTSYFDNTRDVYRNSCNACHTTFPLGDALVRSQLRLSRHIPARVHLSLPDYVEAAHPELWESGRQPSELSNEEFTKLMQTLRVFDATKHAVTLGISCEACHLGAKEHAEGKLKRPKFFPVAPELVIEAGQPGFDFGRTHNNMNWACGRCHAGDRPQFAANMGTWNSTEFTDAMRGSCYTELTCIRCHNPHEAIGPAWSKTPAEDDAVCLSCHQKYQPDDALVAHTRHPLGSEGSNCMNCHMPRINEGLQDVVRTHMIFSPTHPKMIESNQMNACNLCHVDKPIDWTLGYLKDWYGGSYREEDLAGSYPDREQPAAIGWLKSENEAVRLVAADALTRAKADWALPDSLKALDDPFLLNRQFARIGLEPMLGVRLADFGYQFYMTPEERLEPLQRVRTQLLPADSQAAVLPPVDNAAVDTGSASPIP